jgi:O-antigen ligase
MSPILALLITYAFVFWLLRQDMVSRPKLSAALWIPQLWIFVRGSQPVSFWVGGGLTVHSTADYLGGSPVDAFFAFALMVAALAILFRRRLDWGGFISRNRALLMIFLYYGISTLWSDYTWVSFKRWSKECGNVLILLVLLTESDPVGAIKTVFVRCAYVCFPLSVTLYKYYPAIGRFYGPGGMGQVGGIAGSKNSLGEICIGFGLILLWELLEIWEGKIHTVDRRGIYARLAVLGIGLWLLIACESKTSQICGILGAGILLSNRIPFVKSVPKLVVVFGLVILPLVLLGVMAYGVGDSMLGTLGRDATFTDRTTIWALVLSQHTNPVIGTGFYSFWLGQRGQAVWDNLVNFNVTTAHSGYIETYLDGGYVGVFVLVAALAAIGWKLSREFLSGTDFGRVRFMSFVMIIVLNCTETTYFRLSPLWLTFLIMALDVPGHATEPVAIEDEVLATAMPDLLYD